MAVTPAEAIRHLLVNSTAVSGIVGTRIYARIAPAGATLPLGTIQSISKLSDYHLGGMSGVGFTTVQVSWYAETTAALTDLADKARIAIGNQVGTVTIAEGQTLTLHSVILKMQIEDYDMPWGGRDVTAPRIVQDWSVVYTESTS